jgi:hypothetical protein
MILYTRPLVHLYQRWHTLLPAKHRFQLPAIKLCVLRVFCGYFFSTLELNRFVFFMKQFREC